MSATRALVLIPARMAASRLPGKPLADIGGEPMIVHVLRRAEEANIGEVVVATDSGAIATAVEKAGGRAVLTRSDHASGSDRIAEAADIVDPERKAELIVNIQGDRPTQAPHEIRAALDLMDDPAVDIGTIAAVITKEAEKTDPNVVKAIGTPIGPNRLRSLYFTRATAPSGDGPLYFHMGLYVYRRAALAKFVALPPSPLEQRERLEQLRALEAGMRIDIAVVQSDPLDVNTPEDLEAARKVLGR
ncbi:3-deoxy-manno-octulosonate cytidylyltransferase [Variibacter gotjawalensis]|uniref:3-deoxy-manno-octulosonate cytidylyltransferase n=1 Tax=Variibacter gotjawalensis TaxID=1333996 RepID=A0A0S3PQM0_9BRAD|nr:3-deoxy-manno-octulosonate cytidylyltransferase [Variibacter gotjawalensis]RZS50339.1 3-deoxy-manno-octulosonate cytidylyltransferase (CMP-KDO synthetase) [Variibacter gotjawalensis]BAT58172.1 3-deoxy-manno-octulosonate cytidylyltransferase [Variibacter gotjawalensis]